MTIRAKIILAVAIALAGLAAGTGWFSARYMVAAAEVADRNAITQKTQIVLGAIQNALNEINRANTDYACWDDTYAFIEDHNQKYVQSNLVPDTFVNNRIGVMVFIDARGQVVHAEGYDLNSKTKRTVPADLLSAVRVGGALFAQVAAGKEVVGFYQLRDGLYLLSLSPILTSNYNGVPRGSLLFARPFDEAELNRFREITQQEMNIYPLDAAGMPAEISEIASSLNAHQTVVVKIDSDSQIGGYVLLQDVLGRPLFVVHVADQRTHHNAVRRDIRRLISSLLFVSVCVIVVLILSLEGVVLRRLGRLTNAVRRIGEKRDLDQRIPSEGGDELAELGVAFNDLMQTLQHDTEERIRAERALRDAEYSARTFNDALQDAMMLLDSEARVLDHNESAARSLHKTSDQILGRVAFTLINPALVAVRREHFERVLKTGEPQRFDDEWNGRWYDNSFSPIFNAEGKVHRVAAIVREITERKLAEDALRKSEARYRLLAENGSEVVWIMGLDLRFSYVSPSIKRLQGVTPEEAMEMGPMNLLTPASWELVQKRFAEEIAAEETGARDPGRVITLEIEELHKAGYTIWAENLVSFVRDENGKVTGLLGITRDVTERHRVQEALRESERGLRRLTENMTDLILEVDQEGIRRYVSPSHRGVLGLNIEKMIDSPWFDIVHPDDLPNVLAAFAAGIANRNSATLEYRCCDGWGKSRWLETVVSPMYDESGVFTGAVLASRDITQRKQAEQALQNSERLFRSLIENATDVAALLDREGNVLYQSPAVTRNFGWDPSELIGRPAVDPVHPDDVPRVLNTLQQLIRRPGGVDLVTFRFRDKSGNWRYVETIGQNQLDVPGINAIVINTRDVTERRRSDEAARLGELRMRALYDLSQHEFKSENELIEYALEEAVRLTSSHIAYVHFVTADQENLQSFYWSETVRRTCSIPGERHYPLSVAGVWADSARIRRPVVHNEFSRLLGRRGYPEGHPWLTRHVSVPVLDKDRVVIIAGVANKVEPYDEADVLQLQLFMDGVWKIVMRLRAEEEKSRLEEQLRQSHKMEAVGRLAGGVAHDFNNILTGITGYTEMLLDSLNTNDPMRADLMEIKTAADRATALTTQLLAFSRKQVIAPVVLDLNELLSASAKMLKRLIGEDIDFIFLPGDKLARVKADPGQLEQTIVNLAINARDAMPHGGKLIIQTANAKLDEEYCKSHSDAVPGEYVMLAVSDNGTGMDQEVLEHLFEPFFTTKEKGRGTGLGLSMVYGIIKQNKGSINVYSEINRGTTFKLFLPSVAEEPRPLVRHPAMSEIPHGVETILLVEDEEMVRNLTTKILERQGYKVIVAANGGEARLQFEKRRDQIDLLLTDVIMPRMDGRKLSETLRKERPSMKVLFMSGYTEDTIAHHGVLEPGTPFVQKPFTIEALTRKVREVLDS